MADVMDAPNARPSKEAYEDALSREKTDKYSDNDRKTVAKYQSMEAAYTDAMKRNGTDDFSDDDAKVVREWHQANPQVAEKLVEGTPADSDEGKRSLKPLEGSETDYESWTVEELKDELEIRGLTTSGKKAELVARLKENDGYAEGDADQ